MESANEAIRSRLLQHAIALAGFGRAEAAAIVRLINRADEELIERIAARLALIDERGYDIGAASTERLRLLSAEITALNTTVYASVGQSLIPNLEALAGMEAAFQVAALDRTIGIDLGISAPSPERLRAIVSDTPILGKLLGEQLDEQAAIRTSAVRAKIREGLVGQKSVDQIVRDIRGTRARRFEDGILSVSRKSAQSIVITAVNHVANVTAQETWKANSNVVKGWQFLATLDGRTSDKCAALSGSVHPVGSGPIPPRHPRCRSVSVPILKSFREIGIGRDEVPEGTRASMNGQVPASTTMASWLRSQGEGVQEKILGKTKAALFRSGKLSLSDFLDKDGEILTLAQLRQRYGSLLD